MANAGLSAEFVAKDYEVRRKAYAAAMRHSKRIKRLKIILPTAAVLVSAAFVAVSVVRAFVPENVKIERATIENGQIVMEKPAISGRNADGISYSMLADRALQSIAHPNRIRLETIRATVPVNDDLTATVVAKTGIYDRDDEKMDLTEPFSLHMSNGVDASFRSGKLDMKAGTLVTNDTVSITTSTASLVAKRLRIEDKGYNLIFDGGVQVNLNPDVIRNKDE
jgi:lipopolysaccharide export system protein LptC